MRRLAVLVACAVAVALVARADDPYADADETHVISVGDTYDYTPPGVVTQTVCDHVGELVEVTATGMTLHVRALKPGVTACAITGVRDRDDAPAYDAMPDGGRSGILDYRVLVKFVLRPKSGSATAGRGG